MISIYIRKDAFFLVFFIGFFFFLLNHTPQISYHVFFYFRLCAFVFSCFQKVVVPIELIAVLWHVSDVSVDWHVLLQCSARL